MSFWLAQNKSLIASLLSLFSPSVFVRVLGSCACRGGCPAPSAREIVTFRALAERSCLHVRCVSMSIWLIILDDLKARRLQYRTRRPIDVLMSVPGDLRCTPRRLHASTNRRSPRSLRVTCSYLYLTPQLFERREWQDYTSSVLSP
jgi:hypothetical protein